MVFSYGSRREPRGAGAALAGGWCRPRILRTVLRAMLSRLAIWRTETPSTRPRRSTAATLPDGSTSFISSRAGARRDAPRERRVVDHAEGLVQVEAWASRRAGPTQDLAHGRARHAELAGDLAHGDALDQAEAQYRSDVAGGLNEPHLVHTRRKSRPTSRKSPQPTRGRGARRGGVAVSRGKSWASVC